MTTYKGINARLATRLPFNSAVYCCLLMALSLPSYGSSDAKEHATQGAPFEAMEAQAAVEKYQWRIARLQRVINGTLQELELLKAELDAASTVALALESAHAQALNKFDAVQEQLRQSSQQNAGARLQHARFELFLVQRQYNKAHSQLHDIQTMIDDKNLFLTDRQNLLKRNEQGLAWQQQIIRKLENRVVAHRRLAQAS